MVEPPLNLSAARVEAAPDLVVDLAADIDVVNGTTHALVLNGGLNSLAVGLDGDSLAAHGVVVGLGTHEKVGEGNNVDRVILARVVLTTSTLSDIIGQEEEQASSPSWEQQAWGQWSRGPQEQQ
ncbi:hypothetical protein HG530_007471 [Fusarium avenaceum]|nr:hypothetical protein HG530_007471 [Fusarium avenaceum]